MSDRPKIPANIKREVLIEAGHRCSIPTCKATGVVEFHHIVPWVKCQKHETKNMILLCCNCHRLVHNKIIDMKSLYEYKRINKDLVKPVEIKTTFIRFSPTDHIISILDANNVSSITDNGYLDFSINFHEPFEDNTYVFNVLSDDQIKFKTKSKTSRTIRFIFEEPCPETVRFEFFK